MYGTLPKVVQHHVEETRNENESLDFTTSLLQAVSLPVGFFSVVLDNTPLPFQYRRTGRFRRGAINFG